MLQILNQPFDGQLGTILKDKLLEEKYKHFIIMSAFAKNSGVLRMKESLQDFRNRGGKVEAFIGLDAHGTSYEALLNLFDMVDGLYIIHDSSPVRTFHSKIYFLTDQKYSDWMVVGSNNLTGGGLWTNYESAIIVAAETNKNPDIIKTLSEFIKLVDNYKSARCEYSIKINDANDIEKLLKANLLCHEIQLQIETARFRNSSYKRNVDYFKLFGSFGHTHIPNVKREPRGEKITFRGQKEKITYIEPIIPSDGSEKMWFETRAMTGGSRNILDLSMLGHLTQGNGEGTRYETDNSNTVLGSVAFFDITPTEFNIEKNITINYNAKDYHNCTIKYPQTGNNPNGSWRIQLKGETASGEKLTTAETGEWFVHKVIILEKIRTDYYAMSVLPESELDDVITRSVFVAKNGRSPVSKRFGLLDI